MDRNQFKVIIGGKDNNTKNKIEVKNEENRQAFNHSFQYSFIDNINLNDLRFKVKNTDGVYITYYQEDLENGIELERILPIDPIFNFVINVYAPEKYSQKEYGNNLLHRVGTITGIIKEKNLKTNFCDVLKRMEHLNDNEFIMNDSEDNIYDCIIQVLKIKSDFNNTNLMNYLLSSLPKILKFIYGTDIRYIVMDEDEIKLNYKEIEFIKNLGYEKIENSNYWGINFLDPKNCAPEF